MHPAVEDQPVPVQLDELRVRTDLGAAGQVDEFHL
jgi:hypothetical protein